LPAQIPHHRQSPAEEFRSHPGDLATIRGGILSENRFPGTDAATYRNPPAIRRDTVQVALAFRCRDGWHWLSREIRLNSHCGPIEYAGCPSPKLVDWMNHINLSTDRVRYQRITY